MKTQEKIVVKEERTMYLSYNFGAMAYATVPIYYGKSLNQCLKLLSEDINGVVIDGLFIAID